MESKTTKNEVTATAMKLAEAVNALTDPGFNGVVTVNGVAYEVNVRKLKKGVDYDKEEEE